MAELHPVIIRFNYKTEDFDYLDELQDGIERVVTYHKVGEYDTYELDEENNQAIFFLSAHDPEILFKKFEAYITGIAYFKGAVIDVQMGHAQDGTPIVKEYQL